MSRYPRLREEAATYELDSLEKKIILATEGFMTKFSESTLRDNAYRISLINMEMLKGVPVETVDQIFLITVEPRGVVLGMRNDCYKK